MPISFTCPHCGAQTNLADECADRLASCGSCGKTTTVARYGAVQHRPNKPLIVQVGRGIVTGGCIVVALIVVSLAFLPRVGSGRAPKRERCTKNLKQIALALTNYESARHHFPAIGATDKDGQPMQSWRVAILPYLERNELYEKYDHKEPWNGPKNQAIAASMPDIYRCPTDSKASATGQETSYVMIAGDGGVGGLADKDRCLDYISAHSGASDTILVIEVPGSGVHWMDPRDLTIDEVLERLRRHDGSGHSGGFHVAFCDGHTQFIRDDIAPETLRALADPNRTEPVDESKF